MIRDYNWSRGGHYDGALPFPETYFGTSGFRVTVIEGPGYHVHDGETPLTKEDLLADPMAREGTWEFPPLDLLDTLGMHACVMEINYRGPYGSASGTQRVQRNGIWNITNGEPSPPPTDEDLKVCRYWAPGSTLSDEPLHRFNYPGYFLDMNHSQQSNVAAQGGAAIPYGVMGTFRIENFSGDGEPGDDIEIDTGIPLGSGTYTMVFATFLPSGPQERASASISIDRRAIYFPVHQVWILPVTASATSREDAGSITLTNQLLYFSIILGQPENKAICDDIIADEERKFYSARKDKVHHARTFGPSAYSVSPVIIPPDPFYRVTVYDRDFVSASFRDPELSEVFLPFELAAS
jgi:hypothetical protein